MSRDIYSRDESGNKFSNLMEISDDISLIVIQIETILFTRKREVLGSIDMGANLEDLLFSLNANEGEIKSELVNQIYMYCPLALTIPVDVEVKFFKGVEKDVGVIDIFIDGTRAISAVL